MRGKGEREEEGRKKGGRKENRKIRPKKTNATEKPGS